MTATRTDLPYLRRRTLRTDAPPPAAPGPVAPPAVPAAAPRASSSLDLSTPSAETTTPAPAPRTRRVPARVVRRLAPGAAEALVPRQPTVRLTRLQSGVGTLTVEAACSDAVGDLRLGAAFRLRSGASSVVQHATGVPDGPARASRPVLRSGRGRFETITVDLVQVRDLDRMLVFAASATGAPLAWGGTLVVTTFGGARAELPMDGPPGPGVLPLLSCYNVDGELVLRAEPWELAPTVREAALAMGYDRITWLDPSTPAT